MPEDRQTYQRGAAAALIALIAQVVLTSAMALTGLWAESPALHATTFHLLGGLPIWLVLWALYNQHRLERIEALEAEQLARTDAQTAALFQEHADDLQLARRRLENLYKWGLGGVSIFVAAYLLILGGAWLYLNTRSGAAARPGIGQSINPLALLAICLAIAFVGFIVARYVAGMTRIKQWQLLRGGASYLMGNALVAFLSGAVAMLQWLNVPEAFNVLAAVVPALMMLIGAEIILTSLLSAYRPRQPGDVPRPAFDSRALGLLTSPESIAKAISDTINYQFGFEISRSWFYQLLSKAITPLIISGAMILVLLSSVVIVDPHERAMITRFGAIVGTVPPGMHWKWPWPISRAAKYPVGRIHQVSVGSVRTTIDQTKPILWTIEHTTGGEDYLITGATPLASQLGTSPNDQTGKRVPAMALIAADIVIQFRISDLEAFVRTATDPQALVVAMEQRQQWADLVKQWDQAGRHGADPLLNKTPIDPCPLLTAIANRRVNAYFAQRDIDTLLARQRVTAGHELRQQIQDDVGRFNLGLKIVFVGLAGIHPPQRGEVAASFHEQIGALQEKQSAIEKAQAQAIRVLAQVAGSQRQSEQIYEQIQARDALHHRISQLRQDAEVEADALAPQLAELETKINQMVTESQGEAAELIYIATAYRWSRAITERAKADRFSAQLMAYRQAPNYYKQRLHWDMLARAIKSARKMVVPSGTELRIEAKDHEAGVGGLFDEIE